MTKSIIQRIIKQRCLGYDFRNGQSISFYASTCIMSNGSQKVMYSDSSGATDFYANKPYVDTPETDDSTGSLRSLSEKPESDADVLAQIFYGRRSNQ